MQMIDESITDNHQMGWYRADEVHTYLLQFEALLFLSSLSHIAHVLVCL